MTGGGGERLYWMRFEVGKDGAHTVPAPVLVDSVASIQRVVYLLAKFARREDLGQRASFSRALREAFALQCRVPEPGRYAMPFEIGRAAHSPPVAGEGDEVRRLFRRVTAAVGKGDVDAVRALVPDPRYLDCLGDAYRKAAPPPRSGVSFRLEDHRRRTILDSRKMEAALDSLGGRIGRKRRAREDTIELGDVHFCNVAYRASPPLRFNVSYDPHDELYDLDGEFGISVSAASRSDLHEELREALSMLWIEYGEESPERLSPKAQRLRRDLRKRLTAA